jgi:hypothetical protein
LVMHFREKLENQKWSIHMNVMGGDNANKVCHTMHCMPINNHVSRILAVCAVKINDETNMLIYFTNITE